MIHTYIPSKFTHFQVPYSTFKINPLELQSSDLRKYMRVEMIHSVRIFKDSA